MAVAAPSQAWERLGRLLLERRIQIDRRYRNRRLFVAERGLNYKLISDIERHKRTDFGDDTIIAIEMAYAWETGSIGRVLKGGDPQPVADPGQRAPEPEPDRQSPEYAHQILGRLWPQLEPGQRDLIIRMVQGLPRPPASDRGTA
jgi:hypothetical protein